MQVQHLEKEKLIKMDSVKIANYGIDNWFKLERFAEKEEIYAELNLLGRQCSHYIKMRIESKLVLTDLLNRTMPKIKTLLAGKRSEQANGTIDISKLEQQVKDIIDKSMKIVDESKKCKNEYEYVQAEK